MQTALHRFLLATALLAPLLTTGLAAQDEERETVPAAPPRAEGEGPFGRLILRGGTLIDGTGAPARGPVDIVIEDNRITRIRGVGAPGIPIDPGRRPEAQEGDRELDVALGDQPSLAAPHAAKSDECCLRDHEHTPSPLA